MALFFWGKEINVRKFSLCRVAGTTQNNNVKPDHAIVLDPQDEITSFILWQCKMVQGQIGVSAAMKAFVFERCHDVGRDVIAEMIIQSIAAFIVLLAYIEF